MNVIVDNQCKIWLHKRSSTQLLAHFRESQQIDSYSQVSMELPLIAKIIRVSELDGAMMITVDDKIITIRDGSIVDHDPIIPAMVNGIEVLHEYYGRILVLLSREGIAYFVSCDNTYRVGYQHSQLLQLRLRGMVILRYRIKFISSLNQHLLLIDSSNIIHWRCESIQLSTPVKLFHNNAIVMEDDSVIVINGDHDNEFTLRSFEHSLKSITSMIHINDLTIGNRIIQLLADNGEMIVIQYNSTLEFQYPIERNRSQPKRLIILDDQICIEDVNGIAHDDHGNIVELPFMLG